MDRNGRKLRASALVCIMALALGVGIGRASGGSEVRKVFKPTGDGPTIVVRGSGCMMAEDSLKLRLVAWNTDGNGSLDHRDRAVYRCVAP